MRWRKLHRFTALAWLGGLVHSLGMGTDAGQLWFLAMMAIVAIPALALGAASSDPALAYSPAGCRTTNPDVSAIVCDHRVPPQASATVSKRQPATTMKAWSALA